MRQRSDRGSVVRRLALPVAVALAQAPTAGGEAQVRQPTVSCTLSDHSFLVDLVLPLRADGGTDARGMQGRLDIHHQKIPHERRQWSLDRRQPAQFWMHGNELKLRIVLATGEHLVDVAIETSRRSSLDPSYSGSISLRTAEGVKLSGRISCSAQGD